MEHLHQSVTAPMFDQHPRGPIKRSLEWFRSLPVATQSGIGEDLSVMLHVNIGQCVARNVEPALSMVSADIWARLQLPNCPQANIAHARSAIKLLLTPRFIQTSGPYVVVPDPRFVLAVNNPLIFPVINGQAMPFQLRGRVVRAFRAVWNLAACALVGNNGVVRVPPQHVVATLAQGWGLVKSEAWYDALRRGQDEMAALPLLEFLAILHRQLNVTVVPGGLDTFPPTYSRISYLPSLTNTRCRAASLPYELLVKLVLAPAAAPMTRRRRRLRIRRARQADRFLRYKLDSDPRILVAGRPPAVTDSKAQRLAVYEQVFDVRKVPQLRLGVAQLLQGERANLLHGST
jgi:hypothetical protein